jgi:hypothetical protein
MGKTFVRGHEGSVFDEKGVIEAVYCELQDTHEDDLRDIQCHANLELYGLLMTSKHFLPLHEIQIPHPSTRLTAKMTLPLNSQNCLLYPPYLYL